MPDYYSIIEVKPEWVLDQESMGSKEKFWYLEPAAEPQINFLFKYPRPCKGEHWAEKIAAEAARCLDIDHANVELAIFRDTPGSVTESFTQNRLALFHGNQLLELTVQDYDPEMKYYQTFHTLENIWHTLERVSIEPEGVRNAKLRFAEYLILDAVIGNTDRHHENWGLLDDGCQRKLAPSFDHASSLGRELSDTRRDRVLTEGSIRAYSGKAPGGIYWSEEGRNGPSPLELVRRAVIVRPDIYHDYFRPGLLKLEMLTENNILEIVNRVPADWMTDSQRAFAVALMRYNLEQLSELT